jgi:hypothetical protein
MDFVFLFPIGSVVGDDLRCDESAVWHNGAPHLLAQRYWKRSHIPQFRQTNIFEDTL